MTSLRPRPADVGSRRVAIVHDWLTGMRGGEKVLEALRELLPGAELFTLLHVRGTVSRALEAAQPRESFIGHLPMAAAHYRRYIPLFPAAIEQFDLDDFDLVISSSHCVAKSIVKSGRSKHLCYCHTPMRYAWDQFDDYFGPARVGAVRSRLYRLLFDRLARWDAATAGRVDRYIANSRNVAGRIRRYYNRAATVVYPPVDTAYFSPDGSTPGSYFLIVSALVPYKRIDLAVEACRLAGVSLKIVGEGPERQRLRGMTGGGIEFLGVRTDEEVRELYRGARGFLLPGEEDFGIGAVEALACGRPVVGLSKGGATETVEHGRTGVLIDEPTPESFAAGIEHVAATEFDSAYIREQALRFSRDRFYEDMRTAIEATVTQEPDPS